MCQHRNIVDRSNLDKTINLFGYVWHTFNEWFSRHLIDPSVRPVADSTVVVPADSRPQGIWPVDETGNLVQKEGVAIKSANFTSIAQLLGPDSAYGNAFNGGSDRPRMLYQNDHNSCMLNHRGSHAQNEL